MVQSGSNDTNSIFYSADGGNEKVNYYIGLNRFLTNGISAMNDNEERVIVITIKDCMEA